MQRLIGIFFFAALIGPIFVKLKLQYSFKRLPILFALFFFGCTPKPASIAYQELYSHLSAAKKLPQAVSETDCFLVILVDARHLDYSENKSLIQTIAKHPSDGSKNGDVGHAWIFLKGELEDSRTIEIEGGHSGETGIFEAKYFDGVMNYINYGYSNPTEQQKKHPRSEKNPIKYLFEDLHDGFFQKGSGGHEPTFAVKVNLTKQQFFDLYLFIQKGYCYSRYSLIDHQCCSFVREAARLAGVDLEDKITIPLAKSLKIGSDALDLWEDAHFSTITCSSPDVLEKSMMKACEEGRCENATTWYKNTHRTCFRCTLKKQLSELKKIPERVERFIYTQ